MPTRTQKQAAVNSDPRSSLHPRRDICSKSGEGIWCRRSHSSLSILIMVNPSSVSLSIHGGTVGQPRATVSVRHLAPHQRIHEKCVCKCAKILFSPVNTTNDRGACVFAWPAFNRFARSDIPDDCSVLYVAKAESCKRLETFRRASARNG